MKTVTMDFETYQKELLAERAKGYRQGVGEARRVFLELLAGASIEALDIADEQVLMDLAEDLKPRIKFEKLGKKGA